MDKSDVQNRRKIMEETNTAVENKIKDKCKNTVRIRPDVSM